MEHNKILKIIINIISNLIIFILGIIAIFVVWTSIQLNVQNKEYINLFGYSFFNTETRSMSPTLETGDLVIVKLGEQGLQEQDIITYKKGNSFITHRIIKIDGNSITAKGDNNNTQDEEITQDMVVGKVVFTINNVGIWKSVFSDMNVIIPIIITVVLIVILVSYREKTKKQNRPQITKKQNRPQITIFLIVIILAGIQITKTLARYETVGTVERNVDVAFWTLGGTYKTENITLSNIYPSETPFEYTFSVSNFNEAGKRAETDIEYDITLITSTYLPLSYDIVRKAANGEETACTKTEQLYIDYDDTYYRQIKLETNPNNFIMDCSSDKTDTFVIKVTFPKEYSSNLDYADLIEDIKINLSARQIIGD